MNKLIEAATVIAASLFLLIVIGISVSVALLFLDLVRCRECLGNDILGG